MRRSHKKYCKGVPEGSANSSIPVRCSCTQTCSINPDSDTLALQGRDYGIDDYLIITGVRNKYMLGIASFIIGFSSERYTFYWMSNQQEADMSKLISASC